MPENNFLATKNFYSRHYLMQLLCNRWNYAALCLRSKHWPLSVSHRMLQNVCWLTVCPDSCGDLAAMVTLSAAAPDWAGPREHYSHLAVLHWDGVSEERHSFAQFRILHRRRWKLVNSQLVPRSRTLFQKVFVGQEVNKCLVFIKKKTMVHFRVQVGQPAGMRTDGRDLPDIPTTVHVILQQALLGIIRR